MSVSNAQRNFKAAQKSAAALTLHARDIQRTNPDLAKALTLIGSALDEIAKGLDEQTK